MSSPEYLVCPGAGSRSPNKWKTGSLGKPEAVDACGCELQGRTAGLETGCETDTSQLCELEQIVYLSVPQVAHLESGNAMFCCMLGLWELEIIWGIPHSLLLWGSDKGSCGGAFVCPINSRQYHRHSIFTYQLPSRKPGYQVRFYHERGRPSYYMYGRVFRAFEFLDESHLMSVGPILLELLVYVLYSSPSLFSEL